MQLSRGEKTRIDLQNKNRSTKQESIYKTRIDLQNKNRSTKQESIYKTRINLQNKNQSTKQESIYKTHHTYLQARDCPIAVPVEADASTTPLKIPTGKDSTLWTIQISTHSSDWHQRSLGWRSNRAVIMTYWNARIEDIALERATALQALAVVCRGR
jgi:hypothetical protein